MNTGAAGLIGIYTVCYYYIEISENRWKNKREEGKGKKYEEINRIIEHQGKKSRSL